MASQDPETALKGQEHAEAHDDLKSGHQATKQRTAALLSVLSLILLAEAIYRINDVAATPKGHWDQEGSTFAPIVLLLAGVFELVFATLGLAIGLGWSLFDVDHKMLTLALLGIQVVLGSFTYFVFTLAYPAYRISKAPLHPRHRTAAGVFGWILTAVGVNAVVQAGQFLLTLQFSSLQSRVAKLGSQYFRLRTLLLGGLVFLAGLSTFLCGVLVRNEDVNDLQSILASRYSWYPGMTSLRGSPVFGDLNVVRWPAITIVSGILIMVFAVLVGLSALGSGFAFVLPAGLGGLVWAWLITAHIISQYGLISAMLNVQAVIAALLFTSLVVVPLYYLKETHRNKDEA